MVLTLIFTTHCNVSCTKNLHFCERTKRFNNLALIQHLPAVAFWIFFFFCFVFVLEPSILWFRGFFLYLTHLTLTDARFQGFCSDGKALGTRLHLPLSLVDSFTNYAPDAHAQTSTRKKCHCGRSCMKYISSHLLYFLLTRSCLEWTLQLAQSLESDDDKLKKNLAREISANIESIIVNRINGTDCLQVVSRRP